MHDFLLKKAAKSLNRIFKKRFKSLGTRLRLVVYDSSLGPSEYLNVALRFYLSGEPSMEPGMYDEKLLVQEELNGNDYKFVRRRALQTTVAILHDREVKIEIHNWLMAELKKFEAIPNRGDSILKEQPISKSNPASLNYVADMSLSSPRRTFRRKKWEAVFDDESKEFSLIHDDAVVMVVNAISGEVSVLDKAWCNTAKRRKMYELLDYLRDKKNIPIKDVKHILSTLQRPGPVVIETKKKRIPPTISKRKLEPSESRDVKELWGSTIEKQKKIGKRLKSIKESAERVKHLPPVPEAELIEELSEEGVE